jgi:MerR family redox-sensitive transcriptional activator SoxR
MKLLDIAQVSRLSGQAASALRYYEEKKLINSVGRSGLKRLFEPGVLERLALIALGRTAGFSLQEIGQMFLPTGKLSIRREKLLAKADELDRTIKHMAAMREGLRHAANCSAPSHMECPTFRRLIRAAARGRLSPSESMPRRKGRRRK